MSLVKIGIFNFPNSGINIKSGKEKHKMQSTSSNLGSQKLILMSILTSVLSCPFSNSLQPAFLLLLFLAAAVSGIDVALPAFPAEESQGTDFANLPLVAIDLAIVTLRSQSCSRGSASV